MLLSFAKRRLVGVEHVCYCKCVLWSHCLGLDRLNKMRLAKHHIVIRSVLYLTKYLLH